MKIARFGRVARWSCGMALLPFLFAVAAPGQGSTAIWRPGVAAPFPVSGHAMAFDRARGQLVFFGANAQGQAVTLEYDGTQWRDRSPAVQPSARYGHAMAYDAARQRTLLFGGYASGAMLGDTWEWDGATWISQTPTVSPPARYDHAMAYDSARGRVVLIGGAIVQSDETWEWDGATWAKPNLPVRPPQANPAALAYDVARGRCVLQGLFTGTWEYDGTTWYQASPNSPPPFGGVMAYHERRQRVVLYDAGPTFEWDGATWVRQGGGGPAVNAGLAISYDARRGVVVLAGGSSCSLYCSNTAATWEFDSRNGAAYDPIGAGCAGTAGPLSLEPVPSSLPWAGSTFSLTLAPLSGPGVVPVGILGSSSSSWGSTSLPLGLAFLGAPGCSLQTGAEIAVPLATANSTATWNLPIPSSATLVGETFFAQGLALGDPINAAQLVTSGAGRATIGAR